MSQLETQRDELEEDGREIEEALRNIKDCKYTSQLSVAVLEYSYQFV